MSSYVFKPSEHAQPPNIEVKCIAHHVKPERSPSFYHMSVSITENDHGVMKRQIHRWEQMSCAEVHIN